MECHTAEYIWCARPKNRVKCFLKAIHSENSKSLKQYLMFNWDIMSAIDFD